MIGWVFSFSILGSFLDSPLDNAVYFLLFLATVYRRIDPTSHQEFENILNQFLSWTSSYASGCLERLNFFVGSSSINLGGLRTVIRWVSALFSNIANAIQQTWDVVAEVTLTTVNAISSMAEFALSMIGL